MVLFLHFCSDEKKKKNLSTIVSVSELNAFLVVTREKFLEQLSTTLPRYDDGAKITADMDLSRIPAGIYNLKVCISVNP